MIERTNAASPASFSVPIDRQQIAFLCAVAGLVLLGLLVDDSYVLHVMVLICVWAIVAASWDLVLGYAGIFNYAQLVFFAVGAYASAMLAIYAAVPPLVAVLSAGAIGAVAGLLIALPCLRLKGEYIALFTFAIHLALPPVIQQGRAVGMGGNTGLLGIPPMEVFGIVLGPLDRQAWFFFALTVAAICVFLIYFVVLRSRIGRAFVALRDAPAFAQTLGVNAMRYKLIAFVLSAALTAIAGAIYAHYTGVVTPKILGTEFFLMAMIMLAIGGLGRFPGVLIGTVVVIVGNELLRAFDDYRLILLGLGVVLTVIYLPGGLISLTDRWRRPAKS